MLSPEIRRVFRAGRALKRSQRERDEAIRAAHPQHSLGEIADAVGLSKPRVQQIVNER